MSKNKFYDPGSKKTAQELKPGEKIDIENLRFNPVEIDTSREVETDDLCMFCKKDLCECDNTATYGYVKLQLRDCKKVGDLANLRRDFATKTEKEKMDHDYASSSRMAAAKLQAEKKPDNGISLTQEQRSKIFRSPDAIQKYIKTGEY